MFLVYNLTRWNEWMVDIRCERYLWKLQFRQIEVTFYWALFSHFHVILIYRVLRKIPLFYGRLFLFYPFIVRNSVVFIDDKPNIQYSSTQVNLLCPVKVLCESFPDPTSFQIRWTFWVSPTTTLPWSNLKFGSRRIKPDRNQSFKNENRDICPPGKLLYSTISVLTYPADTSRLRKTTSYQKEVYTIRVFGLKHCYVIVVMVTDYHVTHWNSSPERQAPWIWWSTVFNFWTTIVYLELSSTSASQLLLGLFRVAPGWAWERVVCMMWRHRLVTWRHLTVVRLSRLSWSHLPLAPIVIAPSACSKLFVYVHCLLQTEFPSIILLF